jgi:TRAP-type C4-dicarboxylate transport system permease small subunit
VLNLIFKLKSLVIGVEKYVAASSLLLLLIFTLVQIIARNFFDAGFPHLEALSRHLVLFIAFAGAALVCEQNEHIKIDVLSVFLSSQQKQILLKPLLIISAFICAIFAWYAAGFWLDELKYAPTHELWIAYMALVLPAGFSLLSLHFLLLVIAGVAQPAASTAR